jgi:hypothetical protein
LSSPFLSPVSSFLTPLKATPSVYGISKPLLLSSLSKSLPTFNFLISLPLTFNHKESLSYWIEIVVSYIISDHGPRMKEDRGSILLKVLKSLLSENLDCQLASFLVLSQFGKVWKFEGKAVEGIMMEVINSTKIVGDGEEDARLEERDELLLYTLFGFVESQDEAEVFQYFVEDKENKFFRKGISRIIKLRNFDAIFLEICKTFDYKIFFRMFFEGLVGGRLVQFSTLSRRYKTI